MTGKWEALHETYGDGTWSVVETVQSGPNFFDHRHIARGLTEPEARAIAGCRETKAERNRYLADLTDAIGRIEAEQRIYGARIAELEAERDRAVAFVEKFVGWFSGKTKRAPVETATAFLASMEKENV